MQRSTLYAIAMQIKFTSNLVASISPSAPSATASNSHRHAQPALGPASCQIAAPEAQPKDISTTAPKSYYSRGNCYHAQQLPRRVAGLGADAEPVLGARDVEPDVFEGAAFAVGVRLRERVVGAEDFERLRVARRPALMSVPWCSVEMLLSRGIAAAHTVRVRRRCCTSARGSCRSARAGSLRPCWAH